MKEKLSSALSYCLGLCIWGVIIYFTFGRCVSRNIQERKEKQRREFLADSLAKRKQFVADSLANDPHYQDSIRTERERIDREFEEMEAWERAHTLVLVCDSTKTYHTSTKCDSLLRIHDGYFLRLGTENINAYRLVTEQEALDKGYEFCKDCEEIEDISRKYEDGEIVDLEDVEEIARENFDMIKPEEYEPDEPDYDYNYDYDPLIR